MKGCKYTYIHYMSFLFSLCGRSSAREAARMFGWEYIDMMGCTVFARFCQQKSKYLEYLNITGMLPKPYRPVRI